MTLRLHYRRLRHKLLNLFGEYRALVAAGNRYEQERIKALNLEQSARDWQKRYDDEHSIVLSERQARSALQARLDQVEGRYAELRAMQEQSRDDLRRTVDFFAIKLTGSQIHGTQTVEQSAPSASTADQSLSPRALREAAIAEGIREQEALMREFTEMFNRSASEIEA